MQRKTIESMANASYLMPIVGIACSCFIQLTSLSQAAKNQESNSDFAIVTAMLFISMPVIGLIMAIVSLAFVPKFGAKSILVRSIVGIAVNLFVLGFLGILLLFPEMILDLKPR